MRIRAIVVYNKTDLNKTDPGGGNASLDEALDVYAALGYATARCSAKTNARLDELAQLIGKQTAIVVGQSGVGKSTIINRLTGTNLQKTAAVSGKSGEGRHTTVNSAMLPLPSGGVVIDSPGVRDYAPALKSAADVMHGFREISETGQNCRFGNCRHLREPGCAVKSAVENGAISSRRYDSYRHLFSLTERLSGKKY